MSNFKLSRRLKQLPPYLFAEIDRAKNQARDAGKDIIDLGVGDPDQPTPKFIIEALYKNACNPNTHRYSLNSGLAELRNAIARWYRVRFNVELDPDREVLPLIGSKEGIAHLPLAFINPGDIALVPEPGYPPYRSGVIFAGGKVHYLPLLARNKFLPELKKVKSLTANRAKLLFINYPNNPTAAVADRNFFEKVVKFAQKYNIIVAHDAAYSEISFDGYRPMSLLEIPGSKEVGVEFHSLSKTYNMTGWRIGWVCGNASIIEGLAKVKSNIDSGIFMAVQRAGVVALITSRELVNRLANIYAQRRDVLVEGLNALGWRITKPAATFYVWASLPKKIRSSIKFSQLLLEKADIVVTPGVGFGPSGEGYIRMATTVSEQRLIQAVKRIARFL